MNVRKRGLALLMCICMIFTLLPFSALADAAKQPSDSGLDIEFWCTNDPLPAKNAKYTSYDGNLHAYVKSISLNANDLKFAKDIADGIITKDGREYVYWKTMIQTYDDHQTSGGGDNKTGVGIEISTIKKIDNSYYYFTETNPNKEVKINSYDHVVCYYKQVFASANQGSIRGTDWGYLPDNSDYDSSALHVTYIVKVGADKDTAKTVVTKTMGYTGTTGSIAGIGIFPADGYEAYYRTVAKGGAIADTKNADNGDNVYAELTLNRADGDQTVTYYLREIANPTLTYQFIGDIVLPNAELPNNGQPQEYKRNDTVTVNDKYTKDTSIDGDDGYTYTFSGWYKDTASKTPITDEFTITGNTILYGEWSRTANEYNVTYTVTGERPEGYTVPTSKTHAYNTSVGVAAVSDYDGWTFSGWKLADDSTAVTGYTKGDTSFTMPAGDVEFVGTWSRNTANYTVKYVWNGQEIANATTGTATIGKSFTAKAADGNVDSTQYTLKSAASTKTITIDADSSKNEIVFEYYKNVTLTANSKTATYDGTEHSVSGYTCSVEGVTFDGVSAGATGTDANTTANPKYAAEFTGVVIGGTHNDLYIVTGAQEGKLIINPRPITFTASTVHRTWTGSEITVNNVDDNDVTITPNTTVDTVPNKGLLPGHEYKFTGQVYSASGTTVGAHEGTFVEGTKPTITDKAGNDVTKNYVVTLVKGNLIIDSSKTVTTIISGTKTIDGKTPAAEAFQFKLVNANNEEDVLYASNDAQGNFKFEMPYTKTGTYTYELSEVNSHDEYVKYDDTVYKVVITVSEDADGNYEITDQYYSVEVSEKEWRPFEKITFENETTGSLTISKTVAGNAASKDKEFTFIVTLQEALPTRAAANSNITAIDYTDKNKVDYSELKSKAENGRVAIKISLKDGEKFTIEGLPKDIRYTVQELDTNGYTASAKVADKDVTLTDNTTPVASIAVGKTTTVAFTNTKNSTPVNPGIYTEITVEITGNSDSVVYDGAEHNVKGYTVKISDPRYTEKDFTFTGKAEASGVNAGTYEMGLKADQFKNTNALFRNVKFIIKADGVLTITPKDLTITAGSKTDYGPNPVTCDKWTVDGLVKGDKVESVKITGSQNVPGSSPNVASDAVIKNAKGEDVTKNYNIKYVDGTLTMLEVLNKEDHFNYIIGTPEGLSMPTANVTRAEVATIFFRLMTDEARANYDSRVSTFSDVANGAWYTRAIATLANAGIIKGDPAGTFRPSDPITRAEMATIIARFGDFKEGGKTFSDISGHWAQKYIELAASNGWINGNPDGTFKPDNNITRAETVAMINRVLGRQTESNDALLPVAQMTNWSDNADTTAWYYRDMQEATNNHKAERVGDSAYEKWTEKLPDIDWASYQI